MNIQLSDVFSSARYANRNPSWAEYERSAPCDQRAIVKRWAEIWNAPTSRTESDSAFYNWHRALLGMHEDDPRRARTIKDERCEEFERQDDWTATKPEPV